MIRLYIKYLKSNTKYVVEDIVWDVLNDKYPVWCLIKMVFIASILTILSPIFFIFVNPNYL